MICSLQCTGGSEQPALLPQLTLTEADESTRLQEETHTQSEPKLRSALTTRPEAYPKRSHPAAATSSRLLVHDLVHDLVLSPQTPRPQNETHEQFNPTPEQLVTLSTRPNYSIPEKVPSLHELTIRSNHNVPDQLHTRHELTSRSNYNIPVQFLPSHEFTPRSLYLTSDQLLSSQEPTPFPQSPSVRPPTALGLQLSSIGDLSQHFSPPSADQGPLQGSATRHQSECRLSTALGSALRQFEPKVRSASISFETVKACGLEDTRCVVSSMRDIDEMGSRINSLLATAPLEATHPLEAAALAATTLTHSVGLSEAMTDTDDLLDLDSGSGSDDTLVGVGSPDYSVMFHMSPLDTSDPAVCFNDSNLFEIEMDDELKTPVTF